MVAGEPVRNGLAKVLFWPDVIQGLGDKNIRIGCDPIWRPRMDANEY
jgi:hypothetical protein